MFRFSSLKSSLNARGNNVQLAFTDSSKLDSWASTSVDTTPYKYILMIVVDGNNTTIKNSVFLPRDFVKTHNNGTWVDYWTTSNQKHPYGVRCSDSSVGIYSPTTGESYAIVYGIK